MAGRLWQFLCDSLYNLTHPHDKFGIEPRELCNVSSRVRASLSQHKDKILGVLGGSEE